MLEKKYFYRYCEKVVDRLIMQYKEYVLLNEIIQKLENQKLIYVLKKNNKLIKKIDKMISLFKKDREQLSNEMTFANPVIWMIYKYQAYKGASNEIKTIGDFRKHCEPEGYICTLRFKFLKDYLKKKSIDLTDLKKFPDNKDLKYLFKSDFIFKLTADTIFMNIWKSNEYLIENNKVNKWRSSNF